MTISNLEWVRMIYGEPMQVFSDLLRSAITASTGKTLDCADFSAIEVRVLFWLAKHEEGLKAFREGRDLYRELAARIFNTKLAAVTSAQRFVGKTAVLGAGYGLGWKKFKASIEKTGQPVTEELAQLSVKAYREAHRPVTQLWNLLERAAIAAVENLGKRYSIYRTAWWVKGDILWCELPSGRRLAYVGPRVKVEPKPWGEPGPVLYHYGVNSLSKKWELAKTWGGTLTENVVQAIARDLMAEAMLRIEARGWEIVLHVHDEIVGEREMFDESRTNAEFCALMATVPAWGEGIPVAVEGWEGNRYKK